MKSSRANDQRSLPPMLLANETQQHVVRPNCTHDPKVLASELFDEALKLAGIETPYVAERFEVSESLVRRMRSRDARERVTYEQMLTLPASFQIALFRLQVKRLGLGRALIADVMDGVSLLALVVER